MNNTTLILVLALGGVAIFAFTRKTKNEISEPEIVIRERELTSGEKTGGAIEHLWSRISG